MIYFIRTKTLRHIKNMKEKIHTGTSSSSFPQIVKTQASAGGGTWRAGDLRRRGAAPRYSEHTHI